MDLPNEQLDLLLNSSFLSTARVPVHVYGPFDDVEVEVETIKALGATAGGIAKDIISLPKVPLDVLRELLPF